MAGAVVARFRRLTAAEARTLTRLELLDRIEVEQRYWARKGRRTPADDAAEREFSRILYASLNPAEGLADALAYLNGERTGPSYWERKPDVPDATGTA
jgi:hypothetical protein